jgi:hypothetical protein
MKTAYIRISDGVEVADGDAVFTDNGTFVVERITVYGDVYLKNTGRVSLSFAGLKAIQYPAYWIMNRKTGREIAVGDVIAGGEVVTRVSLDCGDVRLSGFGLYYCGSTRDAGYWIEEHERKSYSESPPEMLPHRVRAGVLQLCFNDRWLASKDVLLYDGARYNSITHEVLHGRITAKADIITTHTGCRLLASTAVVINRAGVECYFREQDCVEIDDKKYWKGDVFFLAGEQQWVAELPDDYVELLCSGEYAHVDECYFCSHEDGYALEDGCEEFNGEMYTNGWLSDNTFTCECCGDRFHNDSYGNDGQCDNCYDHDSDSNSRIRDYSCQMANDFPSESRSKIKFGIELEVEPKDDDPSRSLDVFDSLLPARYAVYKEDGSLDDSGFEIVTRPDGPEVHKRIWSDVLADDRVRRTTTSWKSGRCGIHIHVSRAPLSDLWVGRIVVLVHSKKMAAVVGAVAGRYNKSYCEIDNHKKLTSGKGTNCSRYAAINTCLTKTIEFRVFRGTLHRESFIKNIEFVEAVLAYCKPAVSSNALVDDPAGFLQFVANNRKSYINLYEFLVGKSFYGDGAIQRPSLETIAARKALSLAKRKLKQPA